MRLIIERPHLRRGCAIFTHPCINVISISVIENQNVEILTADIEKCTLTSIHKPSKKIFNLLYFTITQPRRYILLLGT